MRLDPLDAKTVGRRLQRARLAAGLSQAQVAQALGIPRPAVSLIESGQRSVTTVELAKLARLYGKPSSAFLEEPETEPLLQYFRAAAPMAESDQAVVGEALEWFRYYAWLERAAFGEQRYEVPIYTVLRGRAIDQGEYLAIQERRRLALGIAPIPSINALLEHQGVKVRARSFPAGSQVSGCYVFAPELGPCVLINRNHAFSRRRFTGAHEYAHFLADRNNVQAFVCSLEYRHELIEMRANAFAAAFLLPAAGLEAHLQELGADRDEVEVEHAVRLMFHFGASYDAVLWRLLNLGWISKDERDRLAAGSSGGVGRALGYGDREPGDGESEPDRFRSVAIEAWRADEISLGKLAELLNIPRAELQQALPPAEITQPRPARAPAAEPDWL